MIENVHVPWKDWEVVRMIGRGGFGTVYEIQRDVFGEIEKAAMKVLTIPQNPQEVDYLRSEGYDDGSISQRFHGYLAGIVREYSMMAKMKGNANVVYCDDYQSIQHRDSIGWDIYIKMELLTPLMQALETVSKEKQIIRLGMELCNALVLCERRNIIHRDIKPQNIFISDDGVFKLGDFGIARTVERTTRATMVGTYQFMAPEVALGRPYGQSVDIYSLGMVLYWLLNKRRMPFLPLPPETATPRMEEEARNRRFFGDPLPAPADGSPQLKEIVLKACAFEPKDRYATAQEMLEALRGLAYKKPEPSTPAAEKTAVFQEKLVLRQEEETAYMRSPEPPQAEPQKQDNPAETPEPQKPNDPVETPQAPVEPVKKKKRIGVFGALFLAIAAMAGIALTLGIFSKPKVVDVSAGAEHTVALYDNGTVAAVGSNEQQQCEVELWTGIVAVDAGGDCTVGICEDGTVVYAGSDADLRDELKQWDNITEIHVEDYCVVGLQEDGTVVTTEKSEEIGSWENVIGIGVGRSHIAGLLENGTVETVGAEWSYKQCNVSDWTNITELVVGAYSTVGLKADGTVVAVGPNEYGQGDVESWQDITAIAAGSYHSVGIRSDGTAVAVGLNGEGQCNIDDWTDVATIDAGTKHTVGVQSDGTVIAVGDNNYGQCDVEKLNK